jgi:hypothetical protein
MTKIKQRKLSQGEKSELQRLKKLEAIRKARIKTRSPLPTSKQWNGMAPVRPHPYRVQ